MKRVLSGLVCVASVLLALVYITHPSAAPRIPIVLPTPTPPKCEGIWEPTTAIYRGSALERAGDFEQAIASYTCAVRIEPTNVWAQSSLAAAFLRHGRRQEALNVYNAAIAAAPETPGYYFQRALIYRQLGDYTRAVADFARAIRYDHQNAWAFNELGTIYMRLGEYVRAYNAYTRAMEIDSENEWFFISRGDVYTALGKPERAALDYERALSLAPHLALIRVRLLNTYYLLARRYDAEGQERAALDFYRRYRKLDGDSTPADVIERIESLEDRAHSDFGADGLSARAKACPSMTDVGRDGFLAVHDPFAPSLEHIQNRAPVDNPDNYHDVYSVYQR